MPIVNGKYVNPIWVNESTPAINATELNAMSDVLERLDEMSFVPQILVDATVTGALVTVTNGTTSYSQTYNGTTLIFKVNSFGTWTVTMTQGSQTSGAITVDITEVKQYPVTLAFFSASIVVSYPVGSTLTATNGSINLTATDTTGNYTFVVPMAGTWTLTITDGNNTASTQVIVSAEGQIKNVLFSGYTMTASTSALAGVSYQTGMFNEYNWDDDLMTEMGQAISNNSSITNRTTTVYLDKGADHYKLEVGDSILMLIDGIYQEWVVLGFNHDQLSSATAYGASSETGMAGISCGMLDCLRYKYAMGSSDDNTGGWGNAAFRTTLMTTILQSMQTTVRGILKTVNKKYCIGGGEDTISTSQDTLSILAESEVSGNAYYNEGQQYAYYLAGNSIVKNVNGAASNWWLRTPNSSQFFSVVLADGSIGGFSATDEEGISVICCF